MNKSKIAVRYSKALFDFAQEKNILEQVYADIYLIKNSIGELSQFNSIFNNVIISKNEKLRIINHAFEGKISEFTLKFIWLLIENQRDNHLYDIVLNFQKKYRKYKNIKLVVITTVNPLAETIKKELIQTLSKDLNSDIELVNENKPEIIGGAIIRIDNNQIDLSTIYQLNELKKLLKSKSYTKDF